MANPSYNPDTNTINLPLVRVLNDPTERLDFVEAKLQLVPGTGLFGFALSGHTRLGEDCAYVNPIATFDFSNDQLHLPILQLFAQTLGDTVFYYHARFERDSSRGVFRLNNLDEPKFACIIGRGKHNFALATGSPGELGLLKVKFRLFSDWGEGNSFII
ncbi:MAG: hypothetical protein DRR08_21940 [Candidatus Parabeggiatoa sp. nov. 2]|nr:MAG: hypothetical protein B6247_04510 [Beggiatoa sp. 4572_84]RKZ56363.1 MAG: hypothetical protein DRR08_21940 [Gammaproteobacteria bacterium]HEC85842.1 hypothetical protein [Thioploca sp.]